MDEDLMNHDMIKKLQKIEEKTINKYLGEGVKELFNDVQKECRDFKENVFYREVVDIDEELTDIFPQSKNNVQNKKKKKRLKIYSDSEDEDIEEHKNKKFK